ncbi:MAG: type II toxin-antitoxin system RatA family toxin [Amphiplicatus sp.]
MTSRRTKTPVSYSAAEMFDLVADVERYPEFLPHCVALRILSQDIVDGAGTLTAEMIVAYGAFRERFKSHVRLNQTSLTIEARYLDGPFRKLHNFWRFTDMKDGSEVDFTIDFEFRSFFLQAAAATVFERAFEKMSEAFVERADEVYGRKAV